MRVFPDANVRASVDDSVAAGMAHCGMMRCNRIQHGTMTKTTAAHARGME
jgi:hypothetical protein